MGREQTSIRGRGAAENPTNRFERIAYERDADWDEPDDPAPKTQFYRDASASLITYNDSPDVGFSASINVYRGCEHGCVYCHVKPRITGFVSGRFGNINSPNDKSQRRGR